MVDDVASDCCGLVLAVEAPVLGLSSVLHVESVHLFVEGAKGIQTYSAARQLSPGGVCAVGDARLTD